MMLTRTKWFKVGPEVGAGQDGVWFPLQRAVLAMSLWTGDNQSPDVALHSSPQHHPSIESSPPPTKRGGSVHRWAETHLRPRDHHLLLYCVHLPQTFTWKEKQWHHRHLSYWFPKITRRIWTRQYTLSKAIKVFTVYHPPPSSLGKTYNVGHRLYYDLISI